MTTAERKLLLLVAHALANLLFWKNVDGRNDAHQILKVAKEIEAESAR